MAAGLKHAVADPSRTLTWATAALLYGGAAVFCMAFGFTRWVMWRHPSWRMGLGVLIIAL